MHDKDDENYGCSEEHGQSPRESRVGSLGSCCGTEIRLFLKLRIISHAVTLHANSVLDRLRTHRTLATIVAIYLAGFLTLGIITSTSQVPYYAVFMMGTLGAVLLWDTRRNLSTLSRGGLALWGALHMAGGMVPIGDDQVLYNLWLLPFVRFDHVVHTVGFGFSGLAFSDALGPRPSLALMGGLGIGALNEMVEFLITRVVPDTNIGGSRTPDGTL